MDEPVKLPYWANPWATSYYILESAYTPEVAKSLLLNPSQRIKFRISSSNLTDSLALSGSGMRASVYIESFVSGSKIRLQVGKVRAEAMLTTIWGIGVITIVPLSIFLDLIRVIPLSRDLTWSQGLEIWIANVMLFIVLRGFWPFRSGVSKQKLVNQIAKLLNAALL